MATVKLYLVAGATLVIATIPVSTAAAPKLTTVAIGKATVRRA